MIFRRRELWDVRSCKQAIHRLGLPLICRRNPILGSQYLSGADTPFAKIFFSRQAE